MRPMSEESRTGEVNEVVVAARVVVPRILDEVLPLPLPRGDGRCLVASRIGLEALRYFEVGVAPLPTRALAVDRNWIEWQREGAEPPMPAGSWSVGVGWETDAPGLSAHVVLELEDDGLLLDLDSAQLARPHRGILVPRSVLTPLVVDGEGRTWAAVDLEEGGQLTYIPHPSPPAFRSAPDWRRSGQRLAGRAIREMRALL